MNFPLFEQNDIEALAEFVDELEGLGAEALVGGYVRRAEDKPTDIMSCIELWVKFAGNEDPLRCVFYRADSGPQYGGKASLEDWRSPVSYGPMTSLEQVLDAWRGDFMPDRRGATLH